MTALHDLQRTFAAGLRHGGTGGMTAHIEDAAGDAAARFDVHRRNRIAALTNSLRLTYPAVHALVGDAFFDAVSEEFIGRHPPRGAVLADYGAEFATFLSVHPQAAALAYLPDVARLEWAAARSLMSAAPGISVKIGALVMTTAPGLVLLRLQYPAGFIWRAALERNETALAAIDLRPATSSLAIWRDRSGVSVVELSRTAGAFVAEILKRGDIDAAAAAAARETPDPVAVIAAEVLKADFISLTPQPKEACDERIRHA